MPAYYHELIGQTDQQDMALGWARDFEDGYARDVPSPSASLDPAEVELFALKSSWDVVKACDRRDHGRGRRFDCRRRQR